jgi:hypothetical protein
MRLRTLAYGAALVAVCAYAQNPGTRIRATPELVQPPPPAATPRSDATKTCERLPTEKREACIARLAGAQPGRRTSGPGTTGMGSGAGAGANAGTTGGGSFGQGAPH